MIRRGGPSSSLSLIFPRSSSTPATPAQQKGTAFLTGIDSWVVKAVINTLFTVLGRHPQDATRAYVYASLVLGPESHGSFTDWKVRCWPVARAAVRRWTACGSCPAAACQSAYLAKKLYLGEN